MQRGDAAGAQPVGDEHDDAGPTASTAKPVADRDDAPDARRWRRTAARGGRARCASAAIGSGASAMASVLRAMIPAIAPLPMPSARLMSGRQHRERVALELVDDAEQADRHERVEAEVVLAHVSRSVDVVPPSSPVTPTERRASSRRFSRVRSTVSTSVSASCTCVEVVVVSSRHQVGSFTENCTDHAPSPARRPSRSSSTTVISWNSRLRSLPLSLATRWIVNAVSVVR